MLELAAFEEELRRAVRVGGHAFPLQSQPGQPGARRPVPLRRHSAVMATSTRIDDGGGRGRACWQACEKTLAARVGLLGMASPPWTAVPSMHHSPNCTHAL